MQVPAQAQIQAEAQVQAQAGAHRLRLRLKRRLRLRLRNLQSGLKTLRVCNVRVYSLGAKDLGGYIPE